MEIDRPKRQKLEEEFKRPPPITLGVEIHSTASENDLLNADFWFKASNYLKDYDHPDSEIQRVKHFYDLSVSSIREAYLSVKEKNGGGNDLFLALRDELASWALHHFASCLRRMRDTLHQLNQKHLSFNRMFRLRAESKSKPVGEDKSSGSTSQPSMDHFITSRESGEQYTIVKRQCIACNLKYRHKMDFSARTDVLYNLEKFLLGVEEEFIRSSRKQEAEEYSRSSIKIRNVLLILKEMLIKMEIHPEDSEFTKKDMETPQVGFADETIEGTDAENMCIKCRSPINPDQDSEVLETIHEDVMISNSERISFSTLFSKHLKLFQRNIQRGFVRRYIMDDETARLMSSVELSVGELWDAITAKVLTLSELTYSVCAAYDADTEYYKIGSDYEEQVFKLSKALGDDLATSFSILSGNLELHRIFHVLMEAFHRGEKLKVWHPNRPKWLHQQ